MTICMIVQENRILLGMKKRGFGAGRWNGFGGKVQPDESIESAALREVREEAGIEVASLDKRGVIDFSFDYQPLRITAHIFSASEFTGEVGESEEMAPQWFLIEDIPYTDMWKSDTIWLPYLLEGKRFSGSLRFSEGDIVLENNIRTE
jgi:8-oxo-dGTP diphosphatase/2-hydroxy-dATP diphosphatase